MSTVGDFRPGGDKGPEIIEQNMAGATQPRDPKDAPAVRELPSPVTLGKDFTTRNTPGNIGLKNLDFVPQREVEEVPKGSSVTVPADTSVSLIRTESPSALTPEKSASVAKAPRKPTGASVQQTSTSKT